MKKFGLIGGVGPESTIIYYREIIKKYREQSTTGSCPDFIIKNIDMVEMVNHVSNNDLDRLTNFLENCCKDLQKAEVDFSAIASNTPHIVFDKLADRVDIPLISIVEETCKKAKEMNIKALGLFGTKSTMLNDFYQLTGKKYGVNIYVPDESDVGYIHEKYMNELIYNDIRIETKNRLIEIAENLRRIYSIEGLIIGGTELSLILKDDDFPKLRVLDSALIHIDAIVKQMLGK